MDVPSELIHEQVNEEAKFEDSLRAFDPLVGDLLAPFHVFDGSKRPWSFIAFPMGESGCDLSENISHLLARRRINATIDFSDLEFSADGRIITESSHYPAMKFETPICQIVSSPTSSNFSKGTFFFILTKEVCHAEQEPWWALGHSHRPHCYHCPCRRPSRERGRLL
jgi:hypothetical protein